MLFKNPEILYALLLLSVPIIVHLFQLRRFEKVLFSNVHFLKNIALKTRKSSQLKKWLTLFTRILILGFIIIAFAQPYQATNHSFTTPAETVIYLDNSFSMQAKGANGTLLNTAIQELIAYEDDNKKINFFTNDLNFPNTSIKCIKNELINLSYSPKQLDYDAVILKGIKAFSNNIEANKNFVIISDFQQNDKNITIEKDTAINYKLVQLTPKRLENLSVDSLYVSKYNHDNLELTVVINVKDSSSETISVSLFESDELIAKNAITNSEAEIVFTIPSNKTFKGMILMDDDNVQYDNTLYFNLEKSSLIKILVINEGNADFLRKIYTKDEFDLTIVNSDQLNYNDITNQNLIIINELRSIPTALNSSLESFSRDGGSVLTIPSNDVDISSYNQLFKSNSLPQYNVRDMSEKLITKINFSHPILEEVFDKKVDNFQYPKVNSFYNTSSDLGSAILSYENNEGFLNQHNNTYAFTASLDFNNSNFKNSPLIVPTLYNIGKRSLRLPKLYYTIGKKNTLDINSSLPEDHILKLENDFTSIIPQQQAFSQKVELITEDTPNTAGIFRITDQGKTIRHISYNYDRKESQLNYMQLSEYENGIKFSSVSSAFDDIKTSTNVNELWKWFVIFAVAFLIVEMLLLKFLK